MPLNQEILASLFSNMSFDSELGLRAGFFRTYLSIRAITENKVLHLQDLDGFFDSSLEEVMLKVRQVVPDLQRIRHSKPEISKSYRIGEDTGLDDREHNIYIWENGYLEQEYRGRDQLTFNIATLDGDILDALVSAIEPFLVASLGQAKVSVITSSDHGPSLINVGEGGSAFNPDNYPAEIAKAFDHIAKDLVEESPCGRLVILTGPPGCGKTYYLEGLIHAQPNCRYILLPPAVLSSLAGPELLQALLPQDEHDYPGRRRSRRKSRRMPTVLIIEDADQCLVRRELDTLPVISTILNLADGILGRALDVRIVATSNAKKSEVDEALMRDGRLCRALDFHTLSLAQARAIYEREVKHLTGTAPDKPLEAKERPAKGRGLGFSVEASEDSGYVLADIYRAAKSYAIAKEKVS